MPLHGINKASVYVPYIVGGNPDDCMVRNRIKSSFRVVCIAECAFFKHCRERNDHLLPISVDGWWSVGLVIDQLPEVAAAAVEKIDPAIIAMIGIQNAF